MPQDQTVVDHLLLGRRALQDDITRTQDDIAAARAEIERLEGEQQHLLSAVDQLDSVIGLINDGTIPAPAARAERRPTTPAAGGPSRAAGSSAPAKRPPTKPRRTGEAPKSIRVHVLEMLAAEDREWSLAEIIDRIHSAGIQAHDDAVRSITIKLMKDGRVERVGRGQYRLARRGSLRSSAPATPPPPAVEEPVTSSAEPVSLPGAEPEPEADPADVSETSAAADAPEEQPVEPADTEPADTEPADTEPADTEPADTEPADTEPADTEAENRSYTPPLNLGQPWN